MGRTAIPRSERGAALLTVLLLVAVMAVVTAGALERLTLATRLATNVAALDQARGYSLAAETLAAARIGDLLGAQGDRTTLQGGWNGGRFTLPIPGGLGSARVSDGGNCFNLNSLAKGPDTPPGTPPPVDAVRTMRPAALAQFQALMVLVGIPAQSGATIAAAAADWIDSDDAALPGGAESDSYLQTAVPYRAANQPMADPSELRVVAGMTPEIYAKLRPWLCALPVDSLSPINVNTLLPGQAPLFAMLLPGLSVGQARELLARRPAGGYGSTSDFWAGPQQLGFTPLGEVGAQVGIRTRWFVVESDIELSGARAHETALYDAGSPPVRLVRRSWGDDA